MSFVDPFHPLRISTRIEELQRDRGERPDWQAEYNPVLKAFASFSTRTPWNRFPVYRYWRIDDLAPDATQPPA